MFKGVCLSTGGVPGLGSAWSGGCLLRAVRILLECILVESVRFLETDLYIQCI